MERFCASVGCLVLALLLLVFWPGKSEAKTSRLQAKVYPECGRVKAKKMDTAKGRDEQPHYEIVEWCELNDPANPKISGIRFLSEGSGKSGPNAAAQAAVLSLTLGVNLFNNVEIGPLGAERQISVTWHPGKNKIPEPKEGVTIYLHHKVRTQAEAYGAGLKSIVGSSHAKATAKTRGPGGVAISVSDVSAPLIGLDSDPQGDQVTYVISHLKSGWKGYVSATVTVVASSWLYGNAEAEAEAEITWEAEIGRTK